MPELHSCELPVLRQPGFPRRPQAPELVPKPSPVYGGRGEMRSTGPEPCVVFLWLLSACLTISEW